MLPVAVVIPPVSRDGPKTQTGIETEKRASIDEQRCGRDGPKTQTGIETPPSQSSVTSASVVATDRKPRPGLKHILSVDILLTLDESRRTENPDRD